MRIRSVDVPGRARAVGYSDGMLVERPGRLLFVAGQVAWDAEQRLVGGGDFAAQFERALANVLEVLSAAGGWPEHVVRLAIFVTDKRLYLAERERVGEAYRRLMGPHYPAMALVQVADLLEEGALVEIEATAALPR